MFTLPLTTLTDNYVYFDCPRSAYIIVNVYNGSVKCGVGRGVSGRDANYDMFDLDLMPGSNPIFGADQLRFKRGDRTSTSTQVTAQANLDEELPRNTTVTGIYTPNYLTIGQDGRVSADFSGIVRASGLQLPSADAAAVVPGADSFISWRNPANTTYVDTWMYGNRFEPRGGFRSSTLWLGASIKSGNAFGFGQPVIDITETDNNIDVSAIRARALGTFVNRTILDVNGWSDFVQWQLSKNPYRIDFGKRTLSAVPAGLSFRDITFNLGFSTAVLLTIAGVYGWSSTPVGLTIGSAEAFSTSQARIYINNPALQDVFITYIAIGY